MKITLSQLPLVALFCAGLAGCVPSESEQGVRIVRSNADEVVLRGLIDATRTEPPMRYDETAQVVCARTDRIARFVAMEQRSTFAFDVIYSCITPN